jgi:pimeloyl-ACP methyl ester carboxylesterase
MLAAIAEVARAEQTSPQPASTEPKPQDSAERRQVTVMFSDLVGSTALSVRMDPEDLRVTLASAIFDRLETHAWVFAFHSYRHRLGLAPGYPQYAEVEAKLAALPVITVPTVTLDGEANAIIPATDGRSSAAKFSGRRVHHRVPNAGHALPQQAPKVFADAVMEVTKPV